MGRIHEDLTWVYQFKFITFLQYMGKYLLKKASVLKTAGIVVNMPEGLDVEKNKIRLD